MAAAARGANLLLMFLLELGVYVAVAFWGLRIGPSWTVKVLAGLGGPLVLAVIWGVLASPRARWPVRGLARAGLEVAWFGAGTAALAAAGLVLPAIVFACLYLVNAALRRLWRQ